jgi:methionyl-tRNA formyltransferase
MPSPRIAFAGTPAFAATALQGLLAGGFEVAVVLSQPDRVAGRGQQLRPGAVKALALAHGLPVLCPARLRPRTGARAESEAAEIAEAAETSDALGRLRDFEPDVLVVAAYGLILPQEVLDLPAGMGDAGCGPVRAINIHGSLLPRWRGAAPVARAIEAGDDTSGVTILQMDAGLDTGPMLLRRETPVATDESADSLAARLAVMGTDLCIEALRGLAAGTLRAIVQPPQGATYAPKIGKGEGRIDWNQTAMAISRRVRAFDPFPGASTQAGGTLLKLWRAHEVPGSGAPDLPGTVLASGPEGILVACGGASRLLVTELQRPGGRRLPAREFLRGFALEPGSTWPG